MIQKDAKTIRSELAKPFAPEDLEWRIQYADEKKSRGIVVPYVTNRAIQSRLDDVVGSENWYNEFKPWHGVSKKEAQICGISIYFEERKQFITKWDGAEDSDIEPVKGGLSDSMKRAAVQWGIGRVLYSMTEPVWVNIEPRGRSWIIRKGERSTMDKAYLDLLDKLKLQPAAPIGTQSELTPRQTADSAGAKSPPASAAGQTKPQPKQESTPTWDCIVHTAMLQSGMSGSNTVVILKYPDGKDVKAYLELKKGGNVYRFPQQPTPKITERQPLPLEARHAAYSDMLEHLTLLDRHGENLLERGLSEERIRRNQYRSMPETERGRRLLAELLRSQGHELLGLPGFRTYYGEWTLSGPNGLMIPVRNKASLIQGIKIRLDDVVEKDTDKEKDKDRKYRWLSSRKMPNGTRSYSWVHVTGDTTRKRAYLTEGPLKGDVASFLAKDALFVCLGGVSALGGLKDTILDLGVTEVVEAMDMDQMANKDVRNAILKMRQELKTVKGLKYTKYTWNPACKGVDDYLLSCAAGA